MDREREIRDRMNERAAERIDEPANQSTNKPVDPFVNNPVSEPVDRPIDRTGDRTSTESVDQYAEVNPNPDPITGEPGAHPVGTGIGATTAGTVGTAIGAVAGPVGAVVGAAIGSVIGGLAGKVAAEAVNPTVEDTYWRENYASRPYAEPNRPYEDYEPAYRTGYEGYQRYYDPEKRYEDVEPELRRNYETNYPQASLKWDYARGATQDAWHRAEEYDRVFQDQDNYWREQHTSRPYYDRNFSYDDYQPAYGVGYRNYTRYRNSGRTYDELEPEFRREYKQKYGSSKLDWEKAKHATRDAWYRLGGK